jgi:lipopolysaccharide transport system permease protein
MAWSEILVRYKQTYLGLGWAIVQPLMSIIIFTLVFNRLARLPTVGEAPYPLVVFGGLLPWHFFAQSLTQASNSLVAQRELITGVQFPRMVLPLKSLAVAAHNAVISFVILLIGLLAYGYLPDWRFIFFPLFILFGGLTALSVGLWISVLNVRYRDFQYLVPYFLQLGMYISPVGFATNIVPMKWRFWYSLNPLVNVIDGCRWSLFRGNTSIHFEATLVSFSFVLLLLWGGFWFFRRAEGTLADHI